MLSATEINTLCEWLIAFRDELPISPTSRSDREKLADVCNALDSYAKLTRASHGDVFEALTDSREFLAGYVDVEDGDYGEPRPNRAMQITSLIDSALAQTGGL